MGRGEEKWEKVAGMVGETSKELGRHWSYNLHNDPKRLLFVLSRYKFCAKMCPRGGSVLELGCSEGLGSPILSEFSGAYVGVDSDGEAVAAAGKNFGGPGRTFLEEDFLGRNYGSFDGIVSLDVIEHIAAEKEELFLETLLANLGEDGVAVVGTPNKTAERYASEASRIGHINLYDAPRLQKLMEKGFHNVFLFAMNDEVVHTGFLPMAHYLLALGCYGRR